jgi:hypothetical protein
MATSLAQDAILASLGFATISTLQTQLAEMQIQILLLRGSISLLKFQNTELQLNMATMQSQIELLQAKVLYVSCAGGTTTIYSPLDVFNPFGLNTITGNLHVVGNITAQNLTADITGTFSPDLLQFNV